MSIFDSNGKKLNNDTVDVEETMPATESTTYIPKPFNTFSRIVPDSTKNPNLNLDVIQVQSKLKKENKENSEHKDGK